MRQALWYPPIELSSLEERIVKRINRAKLFTFLRQWRHELFDEEFQEELNKMYADTGKGHPPIPPAQLALTIIMQAYTGASDAEAIEALTMDRRWQLVVDCLDCEQPPFCQATLVRFRTALIIQGLDRRLIEGSWNYLLPQPSYLAFHSWCKSSVSRPSLCHVSISGALYEFATWTQYLDSSVKELLLQELRQRQLTSAGRAKRRERVAVEHALSHIGRWQGDQARYVGLRKNLFDLRRTAVVHNLHVLARIRSQITDQSAA